MPRFARSRASVSIKASILMADLFDAVARKVRLDARESTESYRFFEAGVSRD